MSGDILDLLLLVVVAAFAVSGYRQGFIIGVLSFFGFVGGALLGAEFGPSIARVLVGGQTQQDIVAVILLVSFAVIGQFLASAIGAAMRQTLTWHSATVLDSVGGSVVSVISVLLIAWVLGSVLNGSPFPLVDQQVNNSLTLRTLDKWMPSPAKTMFSDFRRMLNSNSAYAEVFSNIGEASAPDVPAPDPGVVDSAGYRDASSRVVKVQGIAPSCSKLIEGSGFVISPQHILTNAHVVAGVTSHQTVTTVSGQVYDATVVFYDPQVDIAVLYVPGLSLSPLQFGQPLSAGDEAIVAGFPENSPTLVAKPARVGYLGDVNEMNIYETSTVTRQMYEVRADVEEGNSGGPLVSTGGQVEGVVFAAGVGVADVGYALSAAEVMPDVHAGESSTSPVSTQGCE